MAVDSSAWWPGGRTTAKPFWFRNRRRVKDRSDSVSQVDLQKAEGVCRSVTFSSPAATLKASSMTEPTAMRTAADECISFQTVSLSTCRGQHRALTLAYRQMDWDETDRPRREIASPQFLHREGQHTSSGWLDLKQPIREEVTCLVWIGMNYREAEQQIHPWIQDKLNSSSGQRLDGT